MANPGPASTQTTNYLFNGDSTDGIQLAGSGDDKLGFYGVTPVVQPTGAAQAALTLTTATSGGFGFSTATAFDAAVAQLEEIRASLVALGLIKGSA
jgi:hypothetical protein